MVAEGVETPGQRELLIRAGCAVAQGFLFTRALPADELVAWLERERGGWTPRRLASDPRRRVARGLSAAIRQADRSVGDTRAAPPPARPPASAMANDFAKQLETLQPQLLRFARTQLRNEAWAEDAVSETVVAALEKPQSFAGQSQLKTWLVGILKHKVIDQLRRHKREATMLTTDDNEDLDDLLFAADGHWREMPADWGNPDDVLRQRQFFDVMQTCLDVLPPTQARVFMMREWLELSSDEVCKELTITTTNLWVLLHRARLRLRECLQAGWFDAHPAARHTAR